MAVKYRLVLRRNMAKDVPQGQEKLYYAQTRSTGTCDLDELCEQIAESSTASSGDVKLVLDRMNAFAIMALAKGQVVSLGELGSLQLLLSSKGAPTEEGFNLTLMKQPRVLFRPGAKLRALRKTAKAERLADSASTTTPGTGEGGEEV